VTPSLGSTASIRRDCVSPQLKGTQSGPVAHVAAAGFLALVICPLALAQECSPGRTNGPRRSFELVPKDAPG
jgi:hypothetical protein